MSKQPTPAQVREHYANDIKTASDTQLFAIIRGDIKSTKVVREALQGMARMELHARGVAVPDFTAFFAFR